MNTVTERFLQVFDDLVDKRKVKSIRQLCMSISLKPSQVSEARTSKRDIPIKYAEDLQSIYNVSKRYVLEGTHPMYLEEQNANVVENNVKSNTRDIGEMKYPLDASETPFIDLGDGQYIMIVPLVNEYAYAGYLSGYADPEYLEELPKHTITVIKHHRGQYRAFEVIGDSMNNGVPEETILDGSIVTGRFLQHHHWISRLNTKKYRFWVIVHKTLGIVTKEIVHHDINSGDIICHSLNPNKDQYPDFTVNLDDVKELYNIVHIGKNLTY